MNTISVFLKALTDEGEESSPEEDSPTLTMYDDWPVLEFPDLSPTILDIFTRKTSESVAASLLFELNREDGEGSLPSIRLQTEDQLRWCMQVLNHALTFSFASNREFEAVKGAVRIYLQWLRALTELPEATIPTPLLDTPEKYFRSIIEALRSVFCHRYEIGEVPSSLAMDRQATEIENILDSLRVLTEAASRKYQNEVWTRSLTFMLNSTDLLLADPVSNDEVGLRIGSKVVDTLFDLWFRAVLHEEIPSPTYWKTLAVLSRRWRHRVNLIESWARKLLAMTVLVCRRMYGDDYSRIQFHDDSIAPFGSLPPVSDDGEIDLLYQSWFNIFSLLDSPVEILRHDANKNMPLHEGAVRMANGTSNDISQSNSPLPFCFFLAVTAIQRMIDIFYGDGRVSIEFKESDVLIRRWMMQTVPETPMTRTRTEKASTSVATDTTTNTEQTLTNEGRGSFSSSVSGKEGRTLSDIKRTDKGRISGHRQETSSNLTQAQYSRINPSLSAHATSLPDRLAGENVSTKPEANGSNRLLPGHFVAHAMSVNPVYPPYVGELHPKSERLLALTIKWLLEAVSAKPASNQTNKNISDDVISGLSLHSVDLDDVPDVMNSVSERPSNEKRRSIGSTSSSMTGDLYSSTNTATDIQSGVQSQEPLTVDGLSAGRAAALGALTRIICSKSTSEKLPSQQLASYLAAVHQALIEKDRVVLCSFFYYGHSLFRLSLPAMESILPHYLFALDIILIESLKLRLHPSINEVEMRRSCLRALSSVVCWPTTFGMSKIPQLAESATFKSSAVTYLHLRLRIYKTLTYFIRQETDSTNLVLAISMCTVLAEESCAYDLGLTEEQTREMYQITTQTSGSTQPEKGLCVSIVRGLISAVCDRICRPEWAAEHMVSLAAIDFLNGLSHIPPAVLFSNNDVSTGSLIVASLCRFIETQLMKPPPLHSKDLHSTVVAAYYSIAVWLSAAPMLAECEGVLNTVAEAVQLGVTGSKSHDGPKEDRKSAPASKRVLEAAEYLMYSLFCSVGRGSRWLLCDERRLLYLYGPSAIDTTRFIHFLINGDTILSLHEASHIVTQSEGCPCVLYVRRSPMQPSCVGIARLRPKHDVVRTDIPVPPVSTEIPTSDKSSLSSFSSRSTMSSTATVTSSVTEKSATSSATHKDSSVAHSPPLSIASGSILSGVLPQTTTPSTPITPQTPSIVSVVSESQNSTKGKTPPGTPLRQNFTPPPEFWKNSCRLDTLIRSLESTPDTANVMEALRKYDMKPQRQENNIWNNIPSAERPVTAKLSSATCESVRILLYDMGLIDKEIIGTSMVLLDSGQSADFYRDLHDMVDSCPARALHTAHIFYAKEGQRSPIDILDNALNIQNTSADFCGFLAGLGEGIEAGVHDSWTGHWSTAYSSERKPIEEAEPVDHYILDGVSHSLWWADSGHELAFLMPTERSLRMFKQDLLSSSNTHRSSSYKTTSNISVSSDEIRENVSFDSQQSETFLAASGRHRGSSNVGSERDAFSTSGAPPSRRTSDLRVMIVWLEKAEDILHFPTENKIFMFPEELLRCCDDGSDKPRGERISYTVLFLHQFEPGLVHVRTRGTLNRFGEAGPLCDGMVVSLSSLASFVRLTLLNITRRNVAEIENYQFTHTKRKQAIIDFSKKYAVNITYEDFVTKLITR